MLLEGSHTVFTESHVHDHALESGSVLIATGMLQQGREEGGGGTKREGEKGEWEGGRKQCMYSIHVHVYIHVHVHVHVLYMSMYTCTCIISYRDKANASNDT